MFFKSRRREELVKGTVGSDGRARDSLLRSNANDSCRGIGQHINEPRTLDEIEAHCWIRSSPTQNAQLPQGHVHCLLLRVVSVNDIRVRLQSTVISNELIDSGTAVTRQAMRSFEIAVSIAIVGVIV